MMFYCSLASICPSDPPNGVPEGPGGRQSHGHDGVSWGCQHAAAWVHPVGAHHPSTAEERVQNTSRNCQSPVWKLQSCIWPFERPTSNRQADLVKQQHGGEAKQGQEVTKAWELKLNLQAVVTPAVDQPCSLQVPIIWAGFSRWT